MGPFCFLLLALFFFAPWFSAMAQDTVRIGVSVRNVVLLPFYYAKDKGLFEKEGLRAEIIQMRSNLQVAGVASGELDFMSGVGTAIDAARKGLPLKVVAVLYRAPLFSLVSGGSVTRPKDLEGKKVGVSRVGSESYNAGVWMLAHGGVDVKKVTFIQTGSTTVSMIGLHQGSFEASVLSPPFTGEMVVQGFKVLAKTGDAVEAPFNGMATSAEKLRARPERIRKAVKAMLEATRRIKQERSAVIEYIRRGFNVSGKIAENSYNEIREVMFDDLIMPEERLRKSLDGYFRGDNEKSIAVGDVVDYSILRSLR